MADYNISVETLDPGVVAFAPMTLAPSPHPRVIAVGEGHGDLLKITLQLSEACRTPTRKIKSPPGRVIPVVPLATALANIEVDFASSELPTRTEFVQNDGGGNLGMGVHHRERKNGKEIVTDLHDILIGNTKLLTSNA